MRCSTIGLLVTLALSLVVAPVAPGASAAERTRPFLIGALTPSWGPTPQVVGLRDGLVELGYREHEQFDIGVRFTQGDVTALPAAARQLVEYGVDLIFTTSADATQAAQQVTARIPIVFAGAVSPVKLGLVQSFARPGENITGVTDLGLELGPKRLQVFQELIPGLKRVLFPHNAANVYAVTEAREYREAAHRLGIELVEQAVRTEEEAQTVLAQVRHGEVGGILKPNDVTLNIPGFMLEATVQRGIPCMFDAAFWVEQGGLASYGPDFYATGRQAARLVDKILKGAKPAEIPVEVNPKIEFAINVKTAQALGLTIAPEMLYQADRIVR
jgi:putative ABC transport system substrate-binding protein